MGYVKVYGQVMKRTGLKKFRVIQHKFVLGWKLGSGWVGTQVYSGESYENCESWARKYCSDDGGKTCYYSIIPDEVS